MTYINPNSPKINQPLVALTASDNGIILSPPNGIVGTSGLAGRVCWGTSAADVGSLSVKAPTFGSNYITSFNPVTSLASNSFLTDFLWVNNGIVSATLTAQTINSVTIPTRDIDESTNGNGCGAGLLVTTATTNAGAVATIQLFYTSNLNVGATGTIASFPATATTIAGTVTIAER